MVCQIIICILSLGEYYDFWVDNRIFFLFGFYFDVKVLVIVVEFGGNFIKILDIGGGMGRNVLFLVCMGYYVDVLELICVFIEQL